MLENFIDTKIVLIMISLTIFYFYINNSDNIAIKKNM